VKPQRHDLVRKVSILCLRSALRKVAQEAENVTSDLQQIACNIVCNCTGGIHSCLSNNIPEELSTSFF